VDAPVEDPPAVEEIVVTGTRTGRRLGEEPVAVEVITRDDIERSGAYDVAELLDQHPGVDVTRDVLGASIRLRGLDPDQTLLIVDGQRIVRGAGGVADLSRIPLESIERIEIVKGPASALYGSDALGGVIHVITRPASTREASLQARAATPVSGDASASVSTVGTPGGIRATGGWHASPAFDLDPSDVATDVDRQIQGGGTLRVDPDLGSGWDMPLSGSYTRTDEQGVDTTEGGAVLDRRTLTEEAVITVRPSVLPDAHSRLSFHAGFSLLRDQFLSDQREAAALDVYEETWETLGQLSTQYDRHLGGMLVTFGLEGFLENVRSPRLADGTGNRQRGALYAQDEWKVIARPRLALVPGVRVDVDSQFGGYPAPKLAARLDPLETLTLRSSVGLGWRAPSFRELLLRFENPSAGYVVLGNPDLQPERSRTVDAAAEWEPAAAIALSVSGWWTRLDDLIDITGTGDPATGGAEFVYTNVDEARTRGIEATFGLRPADHLALDLSYTLTDAWNLTDDRALSGRARHRGTVDLDWTVPVSRTRAGARAALVGERPFFLDEQIGVFGPPQEEPTIADPYALVDLRVAQRIVEGLDLFAGVDNLFDAGEPDLLPIPPRLFYVGIDGHLRGRTEEPAP